VTTIVAVGSVRGAPGASTICAAVAAAARPPGVTVVDVDPAGGCLGVMTGLGYERGLVSLAASTRGPLSIDDVDDHLQPWGAASHVLPAPPAGAQVRRALSALDDRLVGALASSPRPVVVDVGRIDERSLARPYVEAAGEVWIVSSATATSALALPGAVEALRRVGATVSLVVVETGPYSAEEVAEYAGVGVVQVVAEDRRAAALVAGRPGRERALRRSPLWRAARALADRLLADGPPAAETLPDDQTEPLGELGEVAS
jgi:MinD-like ATPase involved in chromosome partitioning or flagellar assembly